MSICLIGRGELCLCKNSNRGGIPRHIDPPVSVAGLMEQESLRKLIVRGTKRYEMAQEEWGKNRRERGGEGKVRQEKELTPSIYRF